MTYDTPSCKIIGVKSARKSPTEKEIYKNNLLQKIKCILRSSLLRTKIAQSQLYAILSVNLSYEITYNKFVNKVGFFFLL